MTEKVHFTWPPTVWIPNPHETNLEILDGYPKDDVNRPIRQSLENVIGVVPIEQVGNQASLERDHNGRYYIKVFIHLLSSPLKISAISRCSPVIA